MREQKITAIVLKMKGVGERDSLLSCWSMEKGLVRAWVRASQTLTSRLRPALQPGQTSLIRLTVPNQGLPSVTNAVAQRSISTLFTSLPAARSWQGIVWLSSSLGAEGERNVAVFQTLNNFLNRLDQAGDAAIPILYTVCVHNLVKSFGLALQVPEDPSVSWQFSAASGGFLVSDNNNVIPEELKGLILWLSGLGARPTTVKAQTARQMITYYEDVIRHHFGLKLPSLVWF